MEAAGFLATERCDENHLGDLQGILEFQEVDVFRFLVLDGRVEVRFKALDDFESLV